MRPSLFIDGSVYAFQRHGGINRIYDELIRRLPLMGIPVYVQVFASARLPHRPTARYDFPRWLPQSLDYWKGQRLWHAAAWLNFARSGATAHVGTSYDPKPPLCRLSLVVVLDTIEELGLEGRGPQWDRVLRKKRRAILGADRLIAISYQTREDLLRFYPQLDPARVSVRHLAADSAFAPGEQEEAPAEPYLLYVGRRGFYKNFRQLLTTYLGSERLRQAFALKVVSSEPWTAGETALIASAPGRVRLLPGADDAQLLRLYRLAAALVFPSLYEGFGIPPLEALACGTPVVCCARGSMPEVCGDAAVYFDPDRPGDLARTLERVCFDESLRRRLSQAGPARAAGFDWAPFAEHFADLLRQPRRAC